jgi:hypothetical protein
MTRTIEEETSDVVGYHVEGTIFAMMWKWA